MPRLSRKLKIDLAASALLTLICALLFIDVVAGQRDFFIRDLSRYYHPTKMILREIVRAGEFPWWNPYYSAGQPMAANPEYEVFYPLQYLILLRDFAIGFRLHILIHVWLTALGMYAFLRSMRLRGWSALFGAIAWGYGGVTLSLINLLPILFAAAWLPLILLFVRRSLRRFTLRDAAFASIFGGTQILVGEPTTLVQTWLIIGMYGLWRIYRLRRRGGRALFDPVAIIGLILVWSVAIGSVQLIPAIDHAGDTVRSRGFDHELVTAWSFPPQRILELAYPHFFGRMDVEGRTLYWAGGGIYGRPASPFLFNIHLGVMMFSLLGAGLLTRRSGRGRWLLFVLPFVVMALGRFNPMFEWAIDQGVRVSFRYPEKFMLAALFGTTVFGSVMFSRALRGDRSLARRAMWILVCTSVVASCMVILGFTPLYEIGFSRLWGVETSRFLGPMLSASRWDWGFSAVAAGAGAVLLSWRTRTSVPSWWAPVTLMLLVLELIPVSLDASPRIQASFYETPALAEELLREQGEFRIFHEVDWYGRSDSARRWFSSGRGVYWVVRNGLYPMTPANYGLQTVLERDYDRTALLPTVDLVRSMWDVRDRGQREWASIFMAMSNAGFRARYRDRAPAIAEADGDFRVVRPIEMWESDPWPRYYLAERIVQIRDRDHFVETLSDDVPDPGTAFVRSESFDPAPGTVEIIRESSSEIRLRTDASGRSLLVISITPHRYWDAEVDGEPRELQVVNVGYQGLVIDEADREVVLRYRNPVVMATAPISILALLLALAGILRGPRRSDQGGSFDRRPTESPSDFHSVGEHAGSIGTDRDP